MQEYALHLLMMIQEQIHLFMKISVPESIKPTYYGEVQALGVGGVTAPADEARIVAAVLQLRILDDENAVEVLHVGPGGWSPAIPLPGVGQREPEEEKH